MPAKQDFSFWNNSGWYLIGNLKDEDGAAVNLDDTSMTMGVRPNTSGADEAVTMFRTSDGGIVITNAALGQFKIQAPIAKTSVLNAGTYDYDIVMQKGADVIPVLYGVITVRAGVAR